MYNRISNVFSRFKRVIVVSLSLILSVNISFSQEAFITTWKTDNEGTSCSSCITIPTFFGESYNYEVDWDNDGVYDEIGINGSVTHDFGVPGTYTIALRGDFPRIFFNNGGDEAKLIDINQWGDIEWSSMRFSFTGCRNLLTCDSNSPNLTDVTDFGFMFHDCTNFSPDTLNWDVSSATSLAHMFHNASSFNGDISNWSTSNVTDMSDMFEGAHVFNNSLSSWDVSRVNNMSDMFLNAYAFNTDLSDWNTSQVTNMFRMFASAETFNQNLNNWDVSNVTNMGSMFSRATSFNGDISDWNTSKVTNMRVMFQFAEDFNQDLSAWDVSNVTSMMLMFSNATSFNKDISNWDISSAVDLGNMFQNAEAFNQDLSAWDVSNVLDMATMFRNCIAFDQSLGAWTFHPDVKLKFSTDWGFLENTNLSCENYSNTLIGWANNPLTPPNLETGTLPLAYGEQAESARIFLEDSLGWVIIGDTLLPNCGIIIDNPFISTWQTDNEGTSCSSCITIPTVGGGYNYDVDWDSDGVYDEIGITGSVTHDFGIPGIYTISIKGELPRIAFDFAGDRLKILTIEQWGDIEWQSFGRAFAGCLNLNINATDVPDLTSVSLLNECFSNCKSLTQGCSLWDVSNVQSFSSTFSGCSMYNEDIGLWDISSAVNLSSMFDGALDFNQDIGNWDVSSVTTMAGMFRFATDFNQNIGNWDVSNVTDMAGLFDGAQEFNQPIGNWDVSSVTTMVNMFGSVSQVIFPMPNAFNQDIGSWDVSSVTNMAEMFLGAENFDQDISSWDVSNVTDMASMFREADAFNQDVSSWNVSKVTRMQSMFSSSDAFDQDLGQWNLTALNNAQQMLNNCGMSCENYSFSIIGWEANSNTPDDISLGANTMMYDDAAAIARTALIAKGWSFAGDSEGDCTTATNDAQEIGVTIYPNPTGDYIKISNDDYDSMAIYDYMGNEIIQLKRAKTVDLTELPSGIYTVKIMDDNGVLVGIQKVMKY